MKNKRTSLVHLIYFSRLTISNEPALRAKQIGDITRQAQKKNEFALTDWRSPSTTWIAKFWSMIRKLVITANSFFF
jgi:hypothetical protein